MHFALLGSSGFVGSEFGKQIRARGYRLTTISRQECDIYDPTELSRILQFSRVDYLINSAGYTGKPNVDAAEKDKATCLAGNAVLPGILGEACNHVGIPWGHVSSGCIFTGRRSDGGGFTETDIPNFTFRQNNCSFYSGTKALGEEVLTGSDNLYIWRLRIPFSNECSPRNYLTKVMKYERLLDAENSLSNLTEFVSAALDCFEKRLPFGVYNLTNPGSVTTRRVVELIRESGVCRKDFDFFENETDFMANAAMTPRSNCVLDSTKAISAGLKLTQIEDSLRESLSNWNKSELISTLLEKTIDP
jgi:dTDP-4-dehydrorhamnose reductase